MTLLYIILASLISGLIALFAALLLIKGKLWSHNRSHHFVSFAAGTLLAVAFLDLLPESFEALEASRGGDIIETGAFYVLLGFLIFFLIEKLILWHHCHEDHCRVKANASVVLVGDTLHNFLDGIAIAAAFLVDPAVGVVATLAVFAHEIPQEVADFSILLRSGMKQGKALMFNVLSSIASLVGAILTYFFATSIEGVIPVLLALTAGGFIYIAATDLIPEIHEEGPRSHMLLQFLLFFLGIIIVFFVTQIFAH